MLHDLIPGMICGFILGFVVRFLFRGVSAKRLRIRRRLF